MIKKDIQKALGVKKAIGLSLQDTLDQDYQIDGGEVRLLNDDEILATIENPEDIFHQY